ncbi:MAG: hypothetical protein LOD89_05560, partial [Tissierellales bacterium]
VQTLSRLNRTCPGKEDTFVLDFVNKAEDIQEAFKPYYQATIVEEVTEPNLLYDIENQLHAYGVYLKDEIDRFNNIYFKTKDKKASQDRAILNYLIDKAVERFKKLEDQRKQDFSSQATKFIRLYSFILQITPFEDVELHKLYVYLTYLLKKLPKEKGSTIHLADEVALEYYTIKKTFDGSISLTPEDGNTPVTPVRFAGTVVKEEQTEYLSTIIERLNKRFGTNFTKADQLSVEQIKEDFAADKDLVQKAKTNTIDDFRFAYEKAFIDKVIDRMGQNQSFFTRVLDDEQFRKALMEYMLVETYQKLKEIEINL